jgi:hypothetical protein
MVLAEAKLKEEKFRGLVWERGEYISSARERGESGTEDPKAKTGIGDRGRGAKKCSDRRPSWNLWRGCVNSDRSAFRPRPSISHTPQVLVSENENQPHFLRSAP